MNYSHCTDKTGVQVTIISSVENIPRLLDEASSTSKLVSTSTRRAFIKHTSGTHWAGFISAWCVVDERLSYKNTCSILQAFIQLLWQAFVKLDERLISVQRAFVEPAQGAGW